MKNIRDSIKLYRFNIGRIAAFEIVLQIVSAALLIPVSYAFLNLIIRLSGIRYLSRDNVAHFFRMPTTWIGFVVYLFFLSFILMINASALSSCYDWANHMKKMSFPRMLALGLRHAVRMFVPGNLPMALFIMCFLPLTGASVIGIMLLGIRLPLYITDAIIVNIRAAVIIFMVYLLLSLITFRYIFALHIFVVRKLSFRKAIIESGKMLRGRRFRVVAWLFFVTVLTIGLSWAVHFMLTGPLLDGLLKIKVAGFLAGFIFESLNMVLYLVYVVAGVPLIMSFICNSYYNIVSDDTGLENIDDYAEYDARKSRRRETKVIIGVIVAAIIMDVTFYVLIRTNVLTLNADHMNRVTVTAHRGASKEAPENSMSAFILAIEEGADVIEFDVRETKDGEIVVMHDESLKRTCGVNKLIGNLTLEELRGIYIDAGHGADYPEESIPTLREVIKEVDGRAELNIELKPADTDTALEAKVAEIVKEYDIYDECVVTSLSYTAIKNIKLYDPEIKTVYVMSVAMGNFFDLKYADAFSIKYRYINSEVVRRAHQLGKDIYAWTVNDEKTLERMMMLNVDSIITDKPERMKMDMYKNIYGDTLFEYLNMYLESQY